MEILGKWGCTRLSLGRGDKKVFLGGVPDGVKENFFVVECGDLNGKSKFVDIVGFGSSKTVVFFVDDKFRQFGSALQKKITMKIC